VARAGRDLRDALGDPDRLVLASQRLVGAAELSISQFDQIAAAAYQWLGGRSTDPEREPAVDELLAAALSQIEVANTLLAASHAVGEQGAVASTALDQQLVQLDHAVNLLSESDVQPIQRFQGDVPVASSTVEEVVAALSRQALTTLDAMTAQSTDVLIRSVTVIHDGGPAKIKEAWNWANENLRLDQIGGKLARLGLRALHAALQLLEKVFPRARLAAIENDVEQLIKDMTPGRTVSVMVGAALGVPAVREWVREILGRPGLDRDRLAVGTEELVALSAQHTRRLDLWSGISTAIGAARTLTVVVRIALPHLGLIIMGANLVVVGAVLTVGRKSTAEVRTIVATAMDQRP